MNLRGTLGRLARAAIPTVIDKIIIGAALFLVVLDVSAGMQEIGWTLFWTMFWVFLIYLIVVVIANLPSMFVMNQGRLTKFIFGGFSALMVWLLYPKALELLFWFLGVKLSIAVETVLLWTFIIRAFVGAYLGRRFKEVA